MEFTGKDIAEWVTILTALGGAVIHITRQITELKAAQTLGSTALRGELARVADSLDTLKETVSGQARKVAALEVEVRDLREWKARVEQLLVNLREAGRL